ncbi:MAG: DUF6328 family protein [Mycobacterium sp.]
MTRMDIDETETERLHRNWENLLQELRVTQTGVQLLTGFLLIVPFQQRFDELSHTMRVVYLATVVCSISSTVLLIAPVAMHRLLFRRHRMESVVATAHRFAYSGLLLLGLALVGVTAIIFSSVAGRTAGIVAGGCAAIALLSFWVVLPLVMRITGRPRIR